MKRAKDYMKKEVISFGPHDSLFEVAEIMSKNNISGAPVVDGRKVVGIISVSDIMKFMNIKLPGQGEFLTSEPHSLSLMLAGIVKQGIEIHKEMKKMSKNLVKDFMSEDIVSIGPEATLIEVAEALEKNNINRLPVIDNGSKLVGVISRMDLLRAMID